MSLHLLLRYNAIQYLQYLMSLLYLPPNLVDQEATKNLPTCPIPFPFAYRPLVGAYIPFPFAYRPLMMTLAYRQFMVALAYRPLGLVHRPPQVILLYHM